MDKKEFGAFLEKAAREPGVDRYKKIDEFESDLYELYNNISSWLQEYIDKGQIIVKWERTWFFLIDLEYKLPSLKIQVGKRSVLLNPQMIDFKGEQREVAMDGEADSIYFSLQSHDGPWKVRDTFSSIRSEGLEKELDEETFLQVLMRICTVGRDTAED